MSTEAFLWAIFILLSIALALVIITARRGPWERPMRADVFPVEPARTYPLDEIKATAGPLLGTGVLWVPPDARRLVVGVDPARGDGEEDCIVVVAERMNGTVEVITDRRR